MADWVKAREFSTGVDTESVESSVQTRQSNWAWFLGLLALAALFALGFPIR
jgi:hypothetical protein